MYIKDRYVHIIRNMCKEANIFIPYACPSNGLIRSISK